MYQNPANNIGLAGSAGVGTTNTPNVQSMDQMQQQNINYNGLQSQQQPPQQQVTNKNVRKKPYVKITEQPAGKALRFRYECEGRSAGSIPGVNSTPENKTYPTIEIVGYKGRAVVVVSCVTKDQPYRPHPHNLVGKEGCKKGVCTLEINSETMRAVFSNLGIQCVKKKDIEAALKAREEIRVDPFKTGFAHKFQPSSIDLNSVRLCFQVFMESEQKGRFTLPLPPVVSEPIYDKKAMSDLVICRLCSCSASVLGNTQIILLCEKVAKEDISVRFFEEKNGNVVWEAHGEFQHTDVHKQTAIAFKTPRYHAIDITEPVKVFIQLKRPSDGVTSEALPFEYIPMDAGRKRFWDIRRNLKRKPDMDIFQEIIDIQAKVNNGNEKNNDIGQQTQQQEKQFTEPMATEVIDLESQHTSLDRETIETVRDLTTDELTDVDGRVGNSDEKQEIDQIIDEKMRELEQQVNNQPLQENLPNTLSEVLEILNETDQAPVVNENPNDIRVNEWMKSNEIVRGEMKDDIAAQDDKTLIDLLEQVAELDEIYSDHIVRRDTYNTTLLSELNDIDACVPDANDANVVDGCQTAMEIDESFDDAATYSSLQIAFKNPVLIPMEDLVAPIPHDANRPEQYHTKNYEPSNIRSSTDESTNMHVLTQSQGQTPPRPKPPQPIKTTSPHMHITAAEEEKLPPLPPKRLRKQDSDAENRSIEANIDTKIVALDDNTRQSTPIIKMKTQEQSPPTKCLPPKPRSTNYNTLPKQKKPGFFSKLFSRRKSKIDLSPSSDVPQLVTESKTVTPVVNREPNITHFELNDTNRASIRSSKSLQPMSLPTSPAKQEIHKLGKPVTRSVSSVSGKKLAHLNADVIHIPLKGNSAISLPQNEAYSHASTVTINNPLDRKAVSAHQLSDVPKTDGKMELIAIADRQSLRNICEGNFQVQIDTDGDLTEAEHYALYTTFPTLATASEFDETSAYYAPVDSGEILSPEQVAKRLMAANTSI